VDAEIRTTVQGPPSPQRHPHTLPRFASEERETSQSGAIIRSMSTHTLDGLRLLGFTSGVLVVSFAFGWWFTHGTPPYRRELEATYASFRRFLMTVQAVVVKRLQE
jgi:hypothetical protein